MDSTTTLYYISYTFFKGDEHTGESTKSGHIIKAESDKEAVAKLTKYVSGERDGEITSIHNVENVTGLLNLIADAIQVETDMHGDDGNQTDGLTDFQKHNVGFAVAHWLYRKF